MHDSASEFEDWLGRTRDDPALCQPRSVTDALRFVFWKYGYLLGILVGNAILFYFQLGTTSFLLYAGITAFFTMAVTVGSALAFDERFLAMLSALAAFALVGGGIWWGNQVLGVGSNVSLVLAIAILGGVICKETYEKMRPFGDE